MVNVNIGTKFYRNQDRIIHSTVTELKDSRDRSWVQYSIVLILKVLKIVWKTTAFVAGINTYVDNK